ncbi:sporulation protein YqfC [Haloimpatiens massiliensis]|uniref:sporulation protein YqfC n=1 Tax=Haloimpatiens massiliensis TaxID=1658110 RepID=UPI000C85D03E|nr:sporulation protein YqfC [Haloimpatiens massiliensis]
MEKKMYSAKERFADKLELPRDVVLNLPRITVLGNSEITIENHKGIVLFEDEIIKINTTIGVITIEGSNFEILFIGGNTISLSGKFKNIVYGGNE